MKNTTEDLNEQNADNFPRLELSKYHKFISLSRIYNLPFYKEWRGETACDESVIIIYKNGKIKIGSAFSEIKARMEMETVGHSKLNGAIIHDDTMNIEKLNEKLKLEWVLPDGYMEE